MEWWLQINNWIKDSGIWSGLLANAIWGLLGAGVVSVFEAYRRERRKFAGRWQLTVRWTAEWAEHLFGKEVSDPYSNGDISLSYGIGEHRRQYYGLGYFQLFDGMMQYSHLCVRIYGVKVKRHFVSSRFPFFGSCSIQQWNLESLIRDKLKRFNYSPFAQYCMRFTRGDGDHMEGEMIVTQQGSARVVGSIQMERIV